MAHRSGGVTITPVKTPTRTKPDISAEGLAFWNISVEALSVHLTSDTAGLGAIEAEERLRRYGANSLKPGKRSGWFTLLLAQFKTPIILILLSAAGLSLFLREGIDAAIIMVIVGISGLLEFWQEKSAADAVASLTALVQVKAMVLRDGRTIEIPVEQIVPGDVVVLNAGDVVPADGRILKTASVRR